MNKKYHFWGSPHVLKAFVLCTLLSFSISAFAQKVSIHVQTEPLKSVIHQLEKKSKYRFLYADDVLSNAVPVTISAENKDFTDVVEEIFRTQPLRIQVKDNTVIIRAEQGAQTGKEISGRVSTLGDQHDVAGVTIRLQGANINKFTTTDEQGTYFFEQIPTGSYQLTASFLGYQTHSQPVHLSAQDIVVNISLEETETELSNVVVVGYGSTEQRDLSSSVSKIDSKKLEDFSNNATTFDGILGGAAKGVMVTQNSGEPGSTAKLNIRGITSPLSGSTNEPLYVIDGVPFFIEGEGINPLSNIPVSEIESIDILKDAAATAIYGSRGANGVVIVNTKRGQKNQKFSIHADYVHSFSNPIRNYKPLSTADFIEANATIIRNTVGAINSGQIDYIEAMYSQIPSMQEFANISESDMDDWGFPTRYQFEGMREDVYGNTFTDWNKVVQNKNAGTSQFNLSLTGGNEFTNMAFNFNAVNQDGLYVNDNLKRYNGRMAFDSQLASRLHVGSSFSYSLTKRDDGEWMFPEGDTKAWLVRPDVLPMDEHGEFNRIDGTGLYGFPVMLASPLAQRQNRNNSNLYQFLGSAYAELELVKNLKLRGDVSISSYNGDNQLFTPKVAQDDFSVFGSELYSYLTISDNKNTNTSLNFRLDYDYTKDQHRFKAMAGFGYDRYFLNTTSSWYEDFPDDDVLTNTSSAARVTQYTQNRLDRGLNSMYSRLNYKFRDTYLAEVNFRTDKSSKFGTGNQRAYFPSASVAWRISNEPFLMDVHTVNDLKLRLSWGNTGSTNIDDFLYRQFFVRNSNNLWGGDPGVVLEDILPNRDVKWEKTREYNAGIDFTLFAQRLTGSIDVYDRYTTGALSPAPAPLESGMRNFYSNLVDLSNRGFEFELSYDVIRKQDFGWTAAFNIARNRNKIEKLNGANINPYQVDSFIEGHPTGTLKGYVVEKIFDDPAEIEELNAAAMENGHPYYQTFATGVGDYKFRDLNNDGVINSEDRTVIATPEPKYFGGFHSTMNYKNLGFSFVFQYTKGAKAMASNFMSDSYGFLGQSMHQEVYDNMWTPERTDARYARILYYDASMNARTSDRYVYETSFLRLKNMRLSYSLPSQWTSKYHLSSLHVFASASNVLTFTKWPGLDPELVGQYITTSTQNEDPYPLARTYSLGVKLGL